MYTVSVGDLGKAIAVKVTGSKAGYNSVTRTSAPSSPIEAGDQVLTPVPTITGTPQVGQLLTAVPGTWDDGVTLDYQWTADATDISGATTSAYTPAPADVGKVIRVEVTGTKAGYAPPPRSRRRPARSPSAGSSTPRHRPSAVRRRWPCS